ncbi:MAG TPA: glycoside hydrolase family 2 TIM barrel-domain containing protein [Candidatus Brocadiia bacterium]|nr:glycoside hydrolase family 2 TIM barrel-domain containing protein [Candidatus Brocadiia bacterium]
MVIIAWVVTVAIAFFTFPACAGEGIPLPEHPRPDFMRESWVNLNGAWAFDFDPSGIGEAEQWFAPGKRELKRSIVVPFPWEAKLSGIADTQYKGVAWYSRTVDIPAEWKGRRVWLCFGAVDWSAKAWVNGKQVGEHVGGYTPFAFDITDAAAPGQKAAVVLRVEDTSAPEQPGGKQIGWYTRTSGVWQTIHLEARGDAFLKTLRVIPKLSDGNRKATLTVEAVVGGDAKGASVQVRIGEREANLGQTEETGTYRGTLEIENPRLWSPDDPFLHDAVYSVMRDGKPVDVVKGYVGIREISVAKAPGRDYKYICLNGKPVYLKGALHQSFHPDGIYQYPDDKTLRWDYEYAKRIGLNFFRIHIKTEIPRALYWADKLGILIMEDQPNFGRYNEAAQKNWESVMRGTVERDFNHPSIFAWCNFNETWGIGDGGYKRDHQLWVQEMYRLTKSLDPTRLVEDNSPCLYDHVETDINSWHFYINNYIMARGHIENVVKKTFPGSDFNYASGWKQADAPLINSEYGGISAGSGDQDISWCFKYLTNELRKHDKICGYIYTEQSDIEWEHNGFLNYDRTEKEYGYEFWFPGFGLADINNLDFIVLDTEPCPSVKPGAKLSIPVLLSHWSGIELKEATLNWRADFIDRFGVRHDKFTEGSRLVAWEQFRVVKSGKIEIEVPKDAPAVGAVCVWLSDGDGKKLAANYINFHVKSDAPRVEAIGARRIALRFRPNEFAEWKWSGNAAPPLGERSSAKVFASGKGYAEYRLRIPVNVPVKSLSGLTLLFEASAKALDEKLSWPAVKKPVDYPQTDKEIKWPTDLVVLINGKKVHQATLPDDPSDAHGVLSHAYHFQPGSYGYLTRVELKAGENREIMDELARSRTLTIRMEVPENAKNPGGLALYGEALGCYPTDPTVILDYDADHALPGDYRTDEAIAIDCMATTRETLIPTAEQQPPAWRFTMERPVDGWTSQEFNDREWKVGRGGFGTEGTPNAILNTTWSGPDIWLRMRFDAPRPADLIGGVIRIYHDEDAEVHLNGRKIAERREYVTDYVEITLSVKDIDCIKEKDNVIAVHCRQTTGGQNIDVGFSVFRKKR